MDLATTGAQFGQFLSFLTHRQEIIASNIANADTPGYKSRDVTLPSFGAALTDAGSVVESEGLIARSDGNNVSIDRQAQLLAETTLKFNVTAQLVRSQIKNLRAAIEEGRSS
jgi:flagellar basal-body rod protein FlgB